MHGLARSIQANGGLKPIDSVGREIANKAVEAGIKAVANDYGLKDAITITSGTVSGAASGYAKGKAAASLAIEKASTTASTRAALNAAKSAAPLTVAKATVSKAVAGSGVMTAFNAWGDFSTFASASINTAKQLRAEYESERRKQTVDTRARASAKGRANSME
jgi:hypothetical protein